MSDERQAPPPEPRLERGRRLALDVGTVRIGVAQSDPDGILATPLTTVQRQARADVRAIARIVAEDGVRVVYVGLPQTLKGRDSASTALAREVAAELADAVRVPVHLVDERLSTVDASRMMRASGRRSKEQREHIDAAAAVVILQSALERERTSGERAGHLVPRSRPVVSPLDAMPRPRPRPTI